MNSGPLGRVCGAWVVVRGGNIWQVIVEVDGIWAGLPNEISFIKYGHVLGPDVCPDLMNEFGPSWLLVY